MSVLMIRSKVKAETVPQVEEAARNVFAALQREQPEGIRYSSCRLPDGVTYVVTLAIEEGTNNPLPALPEFQAFQETLKQSLAEPPVAEPLTVIGSYRVF
jgi:hypothetical protein